MNGSLGLVAGALLAALATARWAAAQAALLSVSRSRLRALGGAGDRRAARLTTLLARRAALLAVVGLAHDLALLALAALLVALVGERPDRALAALLAVGLGELALRAGALAGPETTARRHLAWIEAAHALGGDLLATVLREPPSDRDDDDDEETETEETVRELVDTATIDPARRRRIEEILEFPDRTASAVMVPRVDMVGVHADSDLAAAAERITATGRSRLAVFGASRDEVVGVVHARDVLAGLRAGLTLADVARPPLFVAESARLDQLLRALRHGRRSLAVVVDEYGGTAGLVTVEDIVEEIVGEIHDESDQAPPPDLRARAEGGWRLSGGLALAELAQALGLDLPDDLELKTVGGLVGALAGDVPDRGEVVFYTCGETRLAFRIEALEGNRIRDLALVRLPARHESATGCAAVEYTVGAPDEHGALAAPGGAALAAVEAALGYEPSVDAERVAELFAFWPAGRRRGRVVRWRAHQAEAVADSDDGQLSVRFAPATD